VITPATDRNAGGKEQMSGRTDTDRHEAGRYEIRLKGHLDTRWAASFDGLSLTHASDGTTVIHGPIADQAALHGLLQRVRDLGLTLVSVTRDETDRHEQASTNPRSPINPRKDTEHGT
jgi:hypothetical protein